MSAPLSRAACTTTTASDSPDTIRLRAGSSRGYAGVPSGCSDTSAPPAARMRSKSVAVARRGTARPRPVPSTATVWPPASSAPRCAAASIPAAPPETIETPARASPAARSRATSSPYSSGSREPDDRDAAALAPRSPRTRSSTRAARRSGRAASGYWPSPGRMVRAPTPWSGPIYPPGAGASSGAPRAHAGSVPKRHAPLAQRPVRSGVRAARLHARPAGRDGLAAARSRRRRGGAHLDPVADDELLRGSA